MSAALKIFIIYAREDESFKISLLKAFKPLHRSGKIEIFHDGLIKPGERWEEAILENLRTAHIILPLVSNDFFASEFIHEVEFKKAVDRYNRGETAIIPIILKHCGWKYDPVIPTLQVLPKDGKPVVTWVYHEEAWEQILEAVHEVTKQVEEKIRKEKERKEADVRREKEEAEVERKRIETTSLFALRHKVTDWHEEMARYSRMIELDPKNAIAYNDRGNAKHNLGYYEEAIKDFDQAIKLDPVYVNAYNNRGVTKKKSGLLKEAYQDYKIALNINPAHEGAKHNLKALEAEMKRKRWPWG